jgi:uncharacterized coiled-coil protein SlyX
VPIAVTPAIQRITAEDVDKRLTEQRASIDRAMEKLHSNIAKVEAKTNAVCEEAKRSSGYPEPKAKRKKMRATLRKYTDEKCAYLQQLVESSALLQAHMVLNITTLTAQVQELQEKIDRPLANAAQPPAVYGPPNGWVVPMLNDDAPLDRIQPMPARPAQQTQLQGSRRQKAAARANEGKVCVTRLSGNNPVPE